MKLVENRFQLQCHPENMYDIVRLDRLKTKYTVMKEVSRFNTTVMEEDKEFYITENDTLIVSSTQQEEVKRYLSGYDGLKVDYDVTIINEKQNLHPIHLKLNKGMALRDEIQEKYGEYLNKDGIRKLCRMQTGKGKTGSTIISILNMDKPKRIGVLLSPTYFNIWIDAFKKFTNIKDNEFYIIRGRESLYNLPIISKSNVSVVLISTSTTRYVLKDYENGELEEELVIPSEILGTLGIEYLIVDESHEDFNNIYKHVLHLNPYKLICLSATFESINDIDLVKKFKEVLFPEDSRMAVDELDKYVNVILMQFKFENIDTLKYLIPKKRWYSHILLENSILKNNKRKTNYFNMVERIIDRYYSGEGRILIMFSRSDMVREFKTYLENSKYGNKNILTMIQGDNKAKSLLADIIVSTDKSCGTGVDISNLPLTINTINGGSEYATIQGMGRNRKIDGTEVYYVNLWATNIPKHDKYIKIKKKIFRERAKTILTSYYADTEI